jgi:hypothetical protein
MERLMMTLKEAMNAVGFDGQAMEDTGAKVLKILEEASLRNTEEVIMLVGILCASVVAGSEKKPAELQEMLDAAVAQHVVQSLQRMRKSVARDGMN